MRDVDVIIVVVLLVIVGFVVYGVFSVPLPPKHEYMPYNVSRDACMQYLDSRLWMGTYCWDFSGNCSPPPFGPQVGDDFNVTWFVNGSRYELTCYWFELNNVSGYDWVLEVNGSDVAGCVFLCCGYKCHGDVDYVVRVVRGG